MGDMRPWSFAWAAVLVVAWALPMAAAQQDHPRTSDREMTEEEILTQIALGESHHGGQEEDGDNEGLCSGRDTAREKLACLKAKGEDEDDVDDQAVSQANECRTAVGAAAKLACLQAEVEDADDVGDQDVSQGNECRTAVGAAAKLACLQAEVEDADEGERTPVSRVNDCLNEADNAREELACLAAQQAREAPLEGDPKDSGAARSNQGGADAVVGAGVASAVGSDDTADPAAHSDDPKGGDRCWETAGGDPEKWRHCLGE